MILYEFPTVVTNYHKLSGLKQHIYCLTVLEARSLKSVLFDLKSKGHQGCFILKALKEESTSVPSPVSRGQLHPLVLGPCLHLQCHNHISFTDSAPVLMLSFLILTLLPSFCKDPVITFGSPE